MTLIAKKKCAKCNNIKVLNDFVINKKNKDGREGSCRLCWNKNKIKRYRTKIGHIRYIYYNQATRSRKNNWIVEYSINYLISMLMENKIYHELHDNWVKSGYLKKFSPSIDRKNDYIGYTKSNIQLMTWEENSTKGSTDVFEGKNTKKSKPVQQLDKNGCHIKKYKSIGIASRSTGVNRGNISKSCLGDRKTAGGFKWEYIILI